MKTILSALLLAGLSVHAGVSIERFGNMPDGRPVKIFTLKNDNGMVAKIAEYGATLTELHVPDAKGKTANVTLGFDNLKQYLGRHPAFGATIGRFANRIASGKFPLDGKIVEVTRNAGANHIHGGRKGCGKVIWNGAATKRAPGVSFVVLDYVAKDGEEGFPGELKVRVEFILNNANELVIAYSATTSKTTVVNLTNHGYFNLAGSGDILDHELQMFASKYVVPGKGLIPTGEISNVAGMGLDFRKPMPIGKRITEYYDATGGYDHCYVVDGRIGAVRPAARIRDPKSGRVMEVLTSELGAQLYTLNGARTDLTGVGGVRYRRHAGFALETQHYPDSPNHPGFPSTTLRPGEEFESMTVLRFSNGR
ncbi:MAG: aldose epimerase family protein [Limisphaerales bacterium]